MRRLELYGWVLPTMKSGTQVVKSWRVNPIVHQKFVERACAIKEGRRALREGPMADAFEARRGAE